MTQEQIRNLPWYGSEKWALVNRETGDIFFSSDQKESCLDTLKTMTPRHPVYPKLELVERPLTTQPQTQKR